VLDFPCVLYWIVCYTENYFNVNTLLACFYGFSKFVFKRWSLFHFGHFKTVSKCCRWPFWSRQRWSTIGFTHIFDSKSIILNTWFCNIFHSEIRLLAIRRPRNLHGVSVTFTLRVQHILRQTDCNYSSLGSFSERTL